MQNFKIILKPYSKDQLVNKNIQDDFNAIIGLKKQKKINCSNGNEIDIINKSVTREMSDLLQLRNKLEPKRSIIANNIVGRFFKFNSYGEPTFFLEILLIESIDDNTIRRIW